MFFGEYEHTMDPKGRVSMPSKFREKLTEVFYITKGLDACLFVFAEDEWRNIEEKLKTLPLTNKNARQFVRTFYSGAMECSLDKQGRMALSQNLRDYAQLDKDIVLIGVSTRIEVWGKHTWQSYHDEDGLSYEELAEQMSQLGI
jgi:MraZ protein